MTVVQMPDGVNVDFGPLPPDQIKALILKKFPDAGQRQPDQGALSASTNAMGNVLGFNLMDDAVARAAAGIEALTGNGSYSENLDRHLARLHAQDAASAEQHPTAILAGQGGAIVTAAPKAIAGLVAPAMRAATVGERLINAGVGAVKGTGAGAAYSAASGFGAGEGGLGNRLESAAEAVPAGAVTGGLLGAAGGALAKPPVAPPVPVAVAAAADRSGVYVPQALASDNPVVQQAGGAAKSIPYFGTRITDAAKRTVADFTAAKGKIAAEFGGGAAADPAAAGKTARDALENWIGPLTKGVTGNEYKAVDALINPGVKTPLRYTSFESSAISAKNKASARPPGGAVDFVREAVSAPGGLTYQGIKNLRTRVGEMLKTPSLLPSDTSGQELERIYGSLTKDLRAATENAGGPAAKKAFDNANFLYAAVAKRREELMRVLGINPKNPSSPEAVFAAIHRKVGSKSTADIATVNKIRKSMPPDAWDQVASGVVGELGRSDALGTVSLDKFFTGYNQISASGKKALFGNNKPHLMAALDDLATIAGRGKEAAKWANPSGTAQHGAYAALGAAVVAPHLWPQIAGAALGAHFLTRALTRPATVRAMSAWARAWNQVNRGGLGRPAQPLGQSIQYVSRRFAAEIGLQFGLAADKVHHLAIALQGSAPAVAGVPQVEQQGDGQK